MPNPHPLPNPNLAELGKPTRFKKGHTGSRCPRRTMKKEFTEALGEIVAGDKDRVMRVIEKMFKLAEKGNLMAAKMVIELREGLLTQKVQVKEEKTNYIVKFDKKEIEKQEQEDNTEEENGEDGNSNIT